MGLELQVKVLPKVDVMGLKLHQVKALPKVGE